MTRANISLRVRLRTLAVISGLAIVGALAPATPASAAVIVVNTTVDSFDPEGDGGDCSLREAIWAANNDVPIDECPAGDGNDTIVLGPNLTYVLDVNSPAFEEDFGRRGDLDIYQGAIADGDGAGLPRSAEQPEDPLLTIEGHGSIIDGAGLLHCNIFQIFAVPVEMNKLTIQGGGGFVLGEDNFDNGDVPEGGGILVEGTDSGPVTSSSETASSAMRTAAAQGGGVVLDEVIVRGNVASDGGGIYNNGGFIELIDSIVGDDNLTDGADWANIARDVGGGIYLGNGGGEVILDSTDVVGNVAISHGGGIFNFDEELDISNGSNINANRAGLDNPNAEGGGIWTEAGDSLFLSHSTVAGNFAASHGGGIYIDNDFALIDHSTISGNTAGKVCEDCEVEGGDGGGIWTSNPCPDGCPIPTVLTNSTVSGNRALVAVGNNSGLGGGIYLSGGELVISSSTINDNFADVAGGNIAMGVAAQGTFLGNTIISKGLIPEEEILFRGSVAQQQQLQNCSSDSGGFNSEGFNLTDAPFLGDDSDCGLSPGDGDILETDPQLRELNKNAPGLNETHALMAASPAVDAGVPAFEPLRSSSARANVAQPDSLGACPEDDQRGVPRPIDGDGDGQDECDIGAYERRPNETGGGAGGPGGGPGQPGQPGIPGPDPDLPCVIFGTPGNDIIIGTPGPDVICAGRGSDNVFGDPTGATSPSRSSGARAPLVGGNDLVRAGPGKDVVVGGPRHDLLLGHKGRDTLKGGPGIDQLKGGKGNDTLRGQAGNDHMRGGKGRDFLLGGSGLDRCRGGRGRDRIKLC